MLRARKLASAALTAGLVTMGCIGTTTLSAGTAQAAACPAPSDIVKGINAVASSADSLEKSLSALSISSSPDSVQSAAQSTTSTLTTMSSDIIANVTASRDCPPLGPADAQTVATAFDGLAKSARQALSTLLGKHPSFAQFGVTAPIANALRSLEAGFDYYSFALIDAAPGEKDAIQNDKSGLDKAVGDALSQYSQICIPSPLYPTIPPVCVSD